MTDEHANAADPRELLREIVACKDLKESIEAYQHTAECLAGPFEDCPQTKMEREYLARKEAAWSAARAYLASPDARSQTPPREPTVDMIAAAVKRAGLDWVPIKFGYATKIATALWQAMYDAAPAPQATQEPTSMDYGQWMEPPEAEEPQSLPAREPLGWICTHKSGGILHFSMHDGWTLDIVTTEPNTAARGPDEAAHMGRGHPLRDEGQDSPPNEGSIPSAAAPTAQSSPQSLPVPERCPNCNAATGRVMLGGKCSYCAPPAQSSLQSSPQSNLVAELRETAPRACAYLIDIFVDRLAAQERKIERLRGNLALADAIVEREGNRNDALNDAKRELATARARAEAAMLDAKRHRFIRAACTVKLNGRYIEDDAEIDAAMNACGWNATPKEGEA